MQFLGHHMLSKLIIVERESDLTVETNLLNLSLHLSDTYQTVWREVTDARLKLFWRDSEFSNSQNKLNTLLEVDNKRM